MTCAGRDGNCPWAAVAYVFGEGSRRTVVTGDDGLHLASLTPSGARCRGCALDDVDALLPSE